MGSVYLAEQVPIGRKVALKILHRRLMTDLTAIKRFQREARAVASLGHPNTIKLHDFGQTQDDELYLAMEYLEGESLDRLIERDAPLPLATVLTVIRQVLQSLSEAHARGFVHRDIKPQNLFVSQLPGHTDKLIKVLDFGVAKMVGGDATTLTGTGLAVGSPRYMSPEQIRALPVEPRTDLYALGGVIFEMLTGRPLFVRSTASALVAAHVKEDPPFPMAYGRELEGPLVDFMFHCLEKQPEDRPASAATALREVAQLGADAVVCTDGTPYPPPVIAPTEQLPGPTVQLQSSIKTARLDADVAAVGANDAVLDALEAPLPTIQTHHDQEVGIRLNLRGGSETRDGSRDAHASTQESDQGLPGVEEAPLPSDFQRVPSLMWDHRTPEPKGSPPKAAGGRDPAVATAQIKANISSAEQVERARAELARQHEPMAATTPLDHSKLDPEIDKGTIPPPDMLPPDAREPEPKPVATPSVAFTLEEFQATQAQKLDAGPEPSPEPSAPAHPEPSRAPAVPPPAAHNPHRIYILVGIGSALLALIAGVLAASF